MSINIRYPNITALSEKEQLAQVRSYLHQLADQLNYALSTLGAGDGQKQENTYGVQGGDLPFYALKALILQDLQKEHLLTEADREKIVKEVLAALAETPNEEE